MYREDPDAGIHGAAEWTLRQWKQQVKLAEADARTEETRQERSDRRWFVNSQGQTFAMIDGPVEFTMGSPDTEPERKANEIHPPNCHPAAAMRLRRKRSRSGQFQRFVNDKTNNKQFDMPRGKHRAIQPDSRWAMARCNLVCRRRLLQLAEQAGEIARGPVVLRAQEGGMAMRTA